MRRPNFRTAEVEEFIELYRTGTIEIEGDR
jgi:hypothetical protein